MKKVTLWSLIITAVLFAANLLCGIFFGFIFGIPLQGGEVVSYIGFGVMYNKFYPMTAVGETSSGRSYNIVPEFFTLILTFTFIFLIGTIIFLISRACRKRKAKIVEKSSEN